MQETPVLEEIPVRNPIIISETTFFYYPENRAYLLTSNPYAHVKINTPPSNASNQVLVWATLGVMVSFVLLLVSMWALLLLIGSIVLAVLMYSTLAHNQQNSLAQRLRHDGTFLTATLISCISFHEGFGRSKTFEVEAKYEFTSPTGALLHGKEKSARPDLRGVQLPPSGTPAYVLYFNDNEFYLL